MKSMTDEELMDLYQNGDESAFTELYARHCGPLQGFIINSLKSLAPSLLNDSPDILQNVFAWVHTYRQRFIGGTMVKPWLYATANRMVRNHIQFETRQRRDRRRTAPLRPDYDPLAIDQSQTGPLQRVQVKVEQCMAVLPPSHQVVIQLIYFDGHTAEQAAHMLGVPKTTVDWRRRESLAMMRKVEPVVA